MATYKLGQLRKRTLQEVLNSIIRTYFDFVLKSLWYADPRGCAVLRRRYAAARFLGLRF